MQNQNSNRDNSSEKVYQAMIRETFDSNEIDKSQETEDFPGAGFSKQIVPDYESKDNLLIQRLINILTAQLQTLLPGAFRITVETGLCLSYANLPNWSPGRSYFSLFEMKQSNSVWILHFSRSVGEGLASLAHTKSSQYSANVFNNLSEADSITYLEIGAMLRKYFVSLLDLWPKSDKLKVKRCRHTLQLDFLSNTAQDEKYVILPFYLDNRECSGDFHLVFPQRYLLS